MGNDKKEKEACWLTTYILYGMEKICHLSVFDVQEIVGETPIIDYLRDNYPTLHQEGKWQKARNHRNNSLRLSRCFYYIG